MLAATLSILSLTAISTASNYDESLAVLPTSRSASDGIRFLLTTANGDLALVAGDTGAVLWRVTADKPVVVSSSDEIGAPVEFSNHVIVPGLDGTLFFDRDRALDPLQVSIKELVDRAPFQTRDGTRFVAQKQTEVVLLDMVTGDVLQKFSADRCDFDANCGAPYLGEGDDMTAAAVWLGRAQYTISALKPNQCWNMTYSEIIPFNRPGSNVRDALWAVPEIFASASGDVFARDRSTGKVIWRTEFGSVLASAYAIIGDDTVKVPIHYTDDDIDNRFYGSVIARLPSGQAVVVSNRIDASSMFHRYDPFLAIAPPPAGPSLGPVPFQAQLPPPDPPARNGDTLQITLNFPDSPIQFSLIVLLTLCSAVIAQAYLRRLISRMMTPVSASKKRKKKSPIETEEIPSQNSANSMTVGKIVVQTGNVLGIGSQGTIVFDGMFEGRPVAVKRLQKHLFSHATHEIAHMIEADSHPSVLRYFAREDDSNFIYVAIERCYCSLADIVAGAAPKLTSPLLTREMRPTSFALRLLSDMVAGVEYLHSRSIVHKDIKPANILITEDHSAKVADMGLSLRLEQDRSSFHLTSPGAGSSGWHAPELMRLDPEFRLTRSVDIFSIGCIIYYVLTRGLHPFGESFERDANIILGRYNLDRIRHLPEAVDLIQAMLSLDSQQRPLCTEVLRHPFFWSDEKKLEFLQEMSDRVEFEKPESPLRLALESQAARIVGRAWNRVIDPSLLDNLGKYRKYQFDSIRDCLRVIRNKKNHYRDLPPDVQHALGEYPSGFLFYFTSRFPSLLLYSFAFAGRFFAGESPLSRHFVGLSEQLLRKHWQVWGGAELDDFANGH